MPSTLLPQALYKQIAQLLNEFLAQNPDKGKILIESALPAIEQGIEDLNRQGNNHTEFTDQLLSHLQYSLSTEEFVMTLGRLSTAIRSELPGRRTADWDKLLEQLHLLCTQDSASVLADSVTGNVLIGDNSRGIQANHYVEKQSTFNQSGQTVGIQFNAGRDLIIGGQNSALPSPFQQPTLQIISDFTGRIELISSIKNLLVSGTVPYVGLLGMGGIGKTWLAIRLANELQEHFADGVLWADFEKLNLEEILRQFAAPFGIQDEIAKLEDTLSMAKRVSEVVKGKRILIVINNATNVAEIKPLLTTFFKSDEAPANSQTLLTTRDRDLLLDIKAKIFEINSWSDQETIDFLVTILGSERILSQATAIEKINDLVGGLPLAICIIASSLRRQPAMKLEKYEEALRNERNRLVKERQDKQLSVEASFELSYKLLDPEVQKLFAQLALFQGPDFDVDAVIAATQENPFDVMDRLGQLHSLSLIEEGLGERKDLVKVEYDPAKNVRYQLHPLLKSFALSKLDTFAELNSNQLAARLAHHYVELAENNSTIESYGALDLDHQNILTSLQWAYARKDFALVVRGALALTEYQLGHIGYLDIRGFWNEAKKILSWAQKGSLPQADSLDNMKILIRLGGFEVRQANYSAAQTILQDASKPLGELPSTEETELQRLILSELLARSHLQSDRSISIKWLEEAIERSSSLATQRIIQQTAFLKIQLSGILTRSGQPDQAKALAEQGLAVLPKDPSTARLTGLMHLGNAHQHISSPETSLAFFHEAQTVAQQIGDVSRLAMIWTNIAWDETRLGHMKNAVEYQQKALEVYRYIGDRYYEAGLGINIGGNYKRLGHDADAYTHFSASIEIAEEKGFLDIEAMAKSNMADWLISSGKYSEASTLLARVKEICDQLDFEYLVSTVLRQQAEVAWGERDYGLGMTLVGEAIDIATKTKDKVEIGISNRVKGSLLLSLGKLDEALQIWTESLQITKDTDLYEYGKTLYTMGTAMMKKDTEKKLVSEIFSWLSGALEVFYQYNNQIKAEEVKEILERHQ